MVNHGKSSNEQYSISRIFSFRSFLVTSSTELHWLDIPSRVTFKLCVLAYRCLHGSAPAYLVRYFTPVSAIAGRSHLRSAASGLLTVPRANTSTIGPRAFAISSPTAWNCLPVDLRDPGHSLLTFRRKLKTHLFNLSSF